MGALLGCSGQTPSSEMSPTTNSSQDVSSGSAAKSDTTSHTQAKTIVLATGFPENSATFIAAECIHREAFKRLGYKVQVVSYPLERALLVANNGTADGEALRPINVSTCKAYPNLVLVNVPLMHRDNVAYAIKPTIHVDGWESLRGKGYRIAYMVGDKDVETLLPKYCNRDMMVPVSGSRDRGLLLLTAGRADLHINAAIPDLVKQVEKSTGTTIRRAGTLDSPPYYLYLHKKHRAIQPRIEEVFRAMREEGRLQQCLDDALKHTDNNTR